MSSLVKCSATLCGAVRRLALQVRAQCAIHGACGRKLGDQIGLEHYDIAASRERLRILATNAGAEIVLRTHLGSRALACPCGFGDSDRLAVFFIYGALTARCQSSADQLILV